MIYYELCYQRPLLSVRKLKKCICYTTAPFLIGKHEWVIVVERDRCQSTGKRRVYPMWRRPQPNESQAFPNDWRPMEIWFTYNPYDTANLGLPKSLQKLYHKKKSEILLAMNHGVMKSPCRWYDLYGIVRKLKFTISCRARQFFHGVANLTAPRRASAA